MNSIAAPTVPQDLGGLRCDMEPEGVVVHVGIGATPQKFFTNSLRQAPLQVLLHLVLAGVALATGFILLADFAFVLLDAFL